MSRQYKYKKALYIKDINRFRHGLLILIFNVVILIGYSFSDSSFKTPMVGFGIILACVAVVLGIWAMIATLSTKKKRIVLTEKEKLFYD